jgi:hypothetical protein
MELIFDKLPNKESSNDTDIQLKSVAVKKNSIQSNLRIIKSGQNPNETPPASVFKSNVIRHIGIDS